MTARSPWVVCEECGAVVADQALHAAYHAPPAPAPEPGPEEPDPETEPDPEEPDPDPESEPDLPIVEESD